MTAIKPIVDEKSIGDLLESEFGKPATGLAHEEGGQIARTFFFSIDGLEYVIRLTKDNLDANYEKEEYAFRTYASSQVPIPAVIRVGRLRDLHFCITRRAAGRPMDRLSIEELERAMPSIIEVLDAIHAVDVSGQDGYGLFDGKGSGFYPSWPASLTCVRDEERPDGFFGEWHHLFETTFLERGVFDRVYEEMVRLLDSCPSDRSLVHGGYGFGNLLVADDRVTAVLDWLDAKYGDFLYDVAGLDFWDPARDRRAIFRRHYAEKGVGVPEYEKRILAYQCYLALDGMRFFAKCGNADAYRWTTDRISSRIEESST